MKNEKEKCRQVFTSLPEKILNRVNAIAEAQRWNLSMTIRVIVERYFERLSEQAGKRQ